MARVGRVKKATNRMGVRLPMPNMSRKITPKIVPGSTCNATIKELTGLVQPSKNARVPMSVPAQNANKKPVKVRKAVSQR
ncbi:hypothetical protein SDC9_153606 [bioreactor metagenome]|uniref:Uncharacterized protein n=1 Tax=bioreactor metagenome TaxID=1076179 RepID=A0A645EY03_9ZZZZ